MVVVVALPLAALVAIGATVAINRSQRAEAAGHVVHTMTVVDAVRPVLAQLETEELTAVGFLTGVDSATDLAAQTTHVSDRVADLEATVGSGLPDRIRTAVDAQGALGPVRQGVSSRTQTPAQVVDAFSTTINSIIASLSLATSADTSTAAGRQVLALDALLRIDAVHAAGAADLLAAAATRDEASIVAYAADQRSAAALENELAAYASPPQMDLYGLVRNAAVQRLGDSFVASFASSPTATIATLHPATLYPQLTSYVQIGGLVEAKIVRDVTTAAGNAQRTSRIDAYVLGGATLVILLLALLLSWLGIRSVSRSLSGLATAARRAADRSEVELHRVADDHAESADHVTLEALPVAARTEVGDFARAFVSAQRSAATVVEQQAAARRNLAQMTGTAGRRSARLVARQANLIDRLERSQSDPRLLDDLRRLDHITNRLRRVTASLLTLAVAGEAGRHAADESGYVTPMALADVIQFAIDEIDSETRVDVSVPAGTMVTPAIIDDVVLLFAELIANAAAFSRAATRVRVFARPFDSGVSIIDEGIGMSEDQLATINARLSHAERLDQASSGALGLFLVGRLARRHDLRVAFEHTPGGGVTAIVDLGHHVTTMAPAETARATARVAAGSSIPRPRDGGAYAQGAGPGLWEPMLALDSRPFDLEKFERAAEMLGAGPTWNAFEVMPTRFAELPAGPSQPELPGRGVATGYASVPAAVADHRARFAGDPSEAATDFGDDDFRDDMPRAGRGFAVSDPTAFFGASSSVGLHRDAAHGSPSTGTGPNRTGPNGTGRNGTQRNGTGPNGTGHNAAGSSGPRFSGDRSTANGSAGTGSRSDVLPDGPNMDLPYAGGPFAGPGRPFAGTKRAFDDPLTGPLRRPGAAIPADAGATTGGTGGPAAGFAAFDGDLTTFPAGGIARYVPPDVGRDVPAGDGRDVPARDGRYRPSDEGADLGAASTDHEGGPIDGDAPPTAATGSVVTDMTWAATDEPPLSRRVPGASSPVSSLDLASRFRTLDPDEARRLVEQFEIGVARALGETATDRVDDEGLSR
jgi:signal transduction histidine kinase